MRQSRYFRPNPTLCARLKRGLTFVKVSAAFFASADAFSGFEVMMRYPSRLIAARTDYHHVRSVYVGLLLHNAALHIEPRIRFFMVLNQGDAFDQNFSYARLYVKDAGLLAFASADKH